MSQRKVIRTTVGELIVAVMDEINLGAAAEPLQVPGIPLILGRRSIVGWLSGSSIDSQDTLSFSLLTGVRAMTEVFPLEPRRRGLRAHDGRSGAFSRRSHYGLEHTREFNTIN